MQHTVLSLAKPSNPVSLSRWAPGRRPSTVRCVATPLSSVGENSDHNSQVLRRNSVFQLACSAAVMAAVARNSFTLLAVPISRELSLSMADIGAIQSALLAGYLVGQVPAGHWADKFGGPRTLMFGLLVWSIFGSATMATGLFASPVLALLILRGGLGLGQSVLMPAISATAAQNFSAAERGDKTSGIYACFSMGTVLGLVLTPLLAEAVGWMGCIVAIGLIGTAIALYGLFILRGCDTASRALRATALGTPPASLQVHQPSLSKAPDVPTTSLANDLNASTALKNNTGILLLCCWTHFVIGFGFFTLQQWMPLFLNGYVQDLKVLGLVSSLPWMGTALVSAGSGRLSLYLANEKQWSTLRIRKFMQTTSSLGIAICLLPLAVLPSVGELTAVLCMCFAVAFQGMCYPGYHSYVQDVFANEAGVVLALTNSWSIVAGVCGNLLCGFAGDFSLVFGVVMCLYIVSAVTFFLGARAPMASNGHATQRIRPTPTE